MPWWAWSALAVAYGAAWRAMFRWLWEGDDLEQGWDVFWTCVLVATLFCWLGVPAVVCHAIGTRISVERAARLLGGESGPAKRRRQKRELAERERRILRAERELGIADHDFLPGETGERYPPKP